MRFKKTIVILASVICLVFPLFGSAAEKWQGTDDLLDRQMQQMTGAAAKEPLIDITQGNMGLFIFAVGGFAAGTLFGYQWRKIFREKAGQEHD